MSIDKQPSNVKIICAISYCFPEEITLQFVNISSVVGTFQSGKSWKKIYHTPASVSYSEKESEINAGKIYTKELQLFYPGNDQAAQDEFSGISNRPVLIKFDYQDGISKLLGVNDNPAILKLDFESANKTGFSALFSQVSGSRSTFI